MKTFVLLLCLLLGNFNFQFWQGPVEKNTSCSDICDEALPFKLPVSGFQLLSGNALDNTFKKVLFHQNNYYVIGSNGKRASLHKFDLTGNQIWSSEVADTSSWNDFIVNASNNILLVGSKDINAGLPKDVLMGVYDLNGNALNLFSYDYGINESYNSIVENPNKTNPATRYVVLGSINLTTNKNDDDVILTAVNEWGATSWRRKYGALNQDDEYHTKLSVYNPISGQLAMSGHLANNGCYVVVDLNTNGLPTNLGRTFGANSRINDLQRTANGEFLLASSILTSPSQAQVIKVSATNPNNFIYRNLNYSGIHQIVSINANSFYAVGTGIFSGVVRPMLFQFGDNGSSLSLNLIRYFSNGETSFNQGSLTKIGTSDFAYADGRVNPGSGIGLSDGYLAIHAGSLDECGLKQLDNSFSKLSFTPVIVQPSSIIQNIKEPASLSAATLNYTVKGQCVNTCIVEFSSQAIDSCGNFQFNASSNLTGTVTFCWNFGDAPPCGSTQQNPIHQYATTGNYNVCVTASNGLTNCQSCHSVPVSFADKILPTIVCPPSITVDCSQLTTPTITGYPTVTDNFDPSPVVSYTDFIIQITPCYKEILRDWTARDFCGNTVHCQQKIVQEDLFAPEIICPLDIAVACTSSIEPEITGFPTVTDNCQAVFNPYYLDFIIRDSCPLIIDRIWFVNDSCGNLDSCVQRVVQYDDKAPTIDGCNRKIIVQGMRDSLNNCVASVLIPSPIVADNCDANPFYFNSFNGTADASGIYPEGTTIIVWTANDNCQNTVHCWDTIVVLPCPCPDTCTTNTLDISTGYDPINGVFLPPGSATSQWTLVESPLWVGAGSAPAYVVSPISGWALTPGAANWISAHPFADWIQNNPEPGIPYTFQNCFCVCEDSSLVGIKMQAYADDAVEICLTDASGNFISNLLSIVSSSSTDHSPFDGSVDHECSHFFNLNAGEYCIRAKLRNLHGVAMGLNIQGIVYGAGLLESVCCNQNNFVSGYKFLDKKCDGERNSGDMPGIGWNIQLKDESGNVVANTFTLGDGFYSFQNVPIGHYTVCEVAQPGYIQSYPPTGSYEIDVEDAHSVISGLNFGNCPLDSCCINEAAFLAVATTPVEVIRDSCMICINHPCIGWCQRMTIDWGDGTTSGYFEGIGPVDASHSYSQSGEYTICLKYEETGNDTTVCFQKDSCFTVCVQCGICEREELALNCFQLFGDAGYIHLANNSNFYIDVADPGYFLATGYYQNGPFPGHILSPSINTDCFVSKYDESCNLCSNFSISGDLFDEGLVIKYFIGGFYIAGISNSTSLNFPGAGTSGKSFSGLFSGRKVFLAKYLGGDCSIPTLDWALVFGNDDYRTILTDMDLDENNNPILVGVFTGSIGFDSYVNPLTFTPASSILSGGSHDMFIVKYDQTNGQQIFAKSLIPSTTNPGGIYPLGVSVEPATGNFYVTGYFKGDVDIDGVLPVDLTGITSGAATFISKYASNGGLIWAFPILAAPSSPFSFQSRGKDIEAYNGGFALGIEVSIPSPLNLERSNPSPFSAYASPTYSSHIVRYDSNGNVICAQMLAGSRYINELSVDGSNNIYFTGAYNDSGDDQIFSYSNFGVMNNSCEVKSFKLDGNGNDDAWSIAPIGSDEFVVIGRTNSVSLNPDPNGSTYYSASGDPDIFIGKYSCECIYSADTFSCCDNIGIAGEKLFGLELQCADSSCCYTTHFNNDAGFSIKNAVVNILTPGWTFGSTSAASGLYVSGTSTTQNIVNPGGNLYGGLTTNFFTFCLSGQIGSSSTQEIEFVWYEKTKAGGCIAVCRDTIRTNCIAPSCGGNCVTPIDMTLVCDSTNSNQYCLFFSVQNLSPYPATDVIIDVTSPNFGLHACGGSGYQDPLTIDLGGVLLPGDDSGNLCVKVVSSIPITNPQDFCVSFGLVFADSSVCFQDTSYCLQIAPCCNPCEEIQIVAREIQVDSSSCCYALDLINNCDIDYFGKIEIESLSPGVSFGNLIKEPAWIYCSPPTPDLVCLDYPGAYLPSGITTDVLQFCIDSSSQVDNFGCWKEIVAGADHTIGLKHDGSIWAWGNNFYGQLGDGTFITKNIPTFIPCPNQGTLTSRSQSTSLIAAALSSMFKVRFYESDDQTVACDTMLQFECAPDTINRCLVVTNAYAECLKDSGGYKITFTIDNISSPGFDATDLIITSPDANVVSISPNSISLYPALGPGDPPRMLMTFVVTSPFPDPDGIIHLQMQLSDATGNYYCNQVSELGITLPECPLECVCDKLSEVTISNSEFSQKVNCTSLPKSYLIKCPKDASEFYIEGNLNCSDSCYGILNWEVLDETGLLVYSGNELTTPTNPLWSIQFAYSQFQKDKPYTVNLNGICGQDTCKCSFNLFFQACDSCCLPKDEFINLVQNAIHMDVDQGHCKATLSFDKLPCDIRIESINWKDGTISTGPFYPGSMVMHAYTPTQMSFLIAVTLVEYDENGKKCNSISLLLPVNLNCLNCCKTGFSAQIQWAYYTSLGLQTEIDGCTVTVTAPQFSDCYFFETSPDWGEPPLPAVGPFPANGTWSHTYSVPGTYTICVTVSEYPYGDPTLTPCRSKKICKTITVTDCNDPCVCEGFSDLSFYYDKTSKRMTTCGDTLTLDCPPNDCIWTFSGNILCKNDCPESFVDWELKNSITGVTVASGTSLAFPGFGVYIPPAIVSAGGSYDLSFTGQCVPNVTCPCSIHLIFPGCNEICPCDPDDLVNDVEKGIGKITILNNCTACFSPVALGDCDMINWYRLPNLSTPFAVSVGNQLVCHNFNVPGNYLIKMEVSRKNADGSICAVYEKIFSISINCFTEPTFSQPEAFCMINALGKTTIGEINPDLNWKPIHGDPKWIVPNSENQMPYIRLNGHLDFSDAIVSKESVCLDEENLEMLIRFSIPSLEQNKHGSRLIICIKAEQSINQRSSKDDWQHGLLKLAQINLSELPAGRLEYRLTFNPKDYVNASDCNDGHGSKMHFVVYLENDLGDHIMNANSELHLESLCILRNELSNNGQIKTAALCEVYPNPTDQSFLLNVLGVNKGTAHIEIFDQFGRAIEKFNLYEPQTKINFGEKYPAALYFLRIRIQDSSEYIKLIKVSK